MIQIQLINNLIELERKKKFIEERGKFHRFEPYVNYLAAPPRNQRKLNNPFTLMFSHRKGSHTSSDFIEALNSKNKSFYD